MVGNTSGSEKPVCDPLTANLKCMDSICPGEKKLQSACTFRANYIRGSVGDLYFDWLVYFDTAVANFLTSA